MIFSVDPVIPKLSNALHRRFITQRIVMIWNNLPYEVKSSYSVKDFKINHEGYKRANIDDIGSENDAYFSSGDY